MTFSNGLATIALIIGVDRLRKKAAKPVSRPEISMFGDPVPKAAFGIPGLDDVLAGGLQRDSVFLLEGSPGTGKTTIALRFLLEGCGSRRNRALHHPVGDREGASPGRRLARLDPWRADRGFRTGAAGKPAGPGPAAEPALFLRSRAGRNDQDDLRGRRALQTDPDRARQPVGNPSARPELASLPPPDPGAQTLFSRAMPPRC